MPRSTDSPPSGLDESELSTIAPDDASSFSDFEVALQQLVLEAEREGVDLTLARDVEAEEGGYWMIEISRVRPNGGAATD